MFNNKTFLLLSKQYKIATDQIRNLIELGGGEVITLQGGKIKNCIGIVSNSDANYDSQVLAKKFRKEIDFYGEELIYESCVIQ